MDAPKSSCFELIQTLIHLGYIIAIDGGKSYYPSRRLLDTAQKISQFNPIKEKQVENALTKTACAIQRAKTVYIGRFQGKAGESIQMCSTAPMRSRYTRRGAGDQKAIHASARAEARRCWRHWMRRRRTS